MFKLGDVVRLKSGGCDMTVVLVDGDYVTVFWISDHKCPVEYVLHVDCLVKVEDL